MLRVLRAVPKRQDPNRRGPPPSGLDRASNVTGPSAQKCSAPIIVTVSDWPVGGRGGNGLGSGDAAISISAQKTHWETDGTSAIHAPQPTLVPPGRSS